MLYIRCIFLYAIWIVEIFIKVKDTRMLHPYYACLVFIPELMTLPVAILIKQSFNVDFIIAIRNRESHDRSIACVKRS